MTNLEEDCRKCNGTTMFATKDLDGNDRQVYCTNCNATGKVPSNEGKIVIAFVTKYIKAGYVRLSQ